MKIKSSLPIWGEEAYSDFDFSDHVNDHYPTDETSEQKFEPLNQEEIAF